MRSLLSIPLSSSRLWEFSFFLIGAYLFLFPCWSHPASTPVALGGGLILLLFRSIPSETSKTLGKFWLFFLVYLFLSVFWSASPGMTLQSAGLVCVGTLLYVMGRDNSAEAQSRLEAFGLLLAFIASVMAVYQWFYGFESLASLLPQLSGEEREILKAAIHNRRASGPFATHGALAAFLILFIPLGFVLRKTSSGLKRKIMGVVTLTLFLGLLATQSVGAFLCLTLAALMVLLGRQSKSTVMTVIVLGFLGITALIFTRGLHSWLLAALGTRLILWKSSLSLFVQNPWFGSGLGTFDEVYQRAGLPMEVGARFTHNIVLQLLVETGLFGAVIFFTAFFGAWRRLKIPSRWEGWGAGTGVGAFLLFSLLDLPFQMPELIWFFAVLSGRLELKPEKELKIPAISIKWLEYLLLAVLLISGFWPPFRPWNFAMVAILVWGLAGYFQPRFKEAPLWIAAGFLFIAARAFFSPSAMGAVWFLEILGVLLAFRLWLSVLPEPDNFLMKFCWLGIAWSLAVWVYSFQYSDIKYWAIFPNPKYVAIFLLGIVLIGHETPFKWNRFFPEVISNTGSVKNKVVFLFWAATSYCLKSFGAIIGMIIGFLVLIPRSKRLIAVVGAGILIALVLVFRVTVFKPLEKSSTQWGRVGIWSSAVKVWERQPLAGVGPGAFSGYFEQVKPPRESGVNRYLMTAQYAENEFLDGLTAFGLIGGVWALFLFRRLWPRNHAGKSAALTALGTASGVSFCLHTPLIALQGVGLLEREKDLSAKPSPAGGMLALGLALGLFGAPVFSSALKDQAEKNLVQHRFFPSDLRNLETAERLNPWDASYPEATADYLEGLYLETRDPVWAKRSDDHYDKVLILEKSDGFKKMRKAERMAARYSLDPTEERGRAAATAWVEAKRALPLSAFAYDGAGEFYMSRGEVEKAMAHFQQAVALEPNDASVWVKVGLLWKKKNEAALAKAAFRSALEVVDRWKNEDRIDPIEKQMVTLPPRTIEFLRKETAP